MTPTNTSAGKSEELGHKASEAIGERIALNAAMLRLFKGEYRDSGDRHSDALFVKDGLEAALIETANLRRELEAATKERDDALKELRPVEKYVQTLTNRVPIDVVLQVVRTCAILGHEKYPKSML
jgi:hypothetical protein